MTATLPTRVTAGLRGRMSGRLALPGEAEYEAARQVWNASHDYRPALVVQPRSADDVRAAVRFAGDHGLPVCVRGGGHNHAGYAVAGGALMLDLSAMASVRVDPARRVAVVGGGATWGVVDQATQAAGLAVTGVDVPAVGVGGATLGGGSGWLHRKLRLSCDNLLAAEIVTADARVLRVSAEEHPELWWFTGPLTAGVIDAIAAAAAGPPPMCAVMLQPLGGAVARVPADATAVRHRDARPPAETRSRAEYREALRIASGRQESGPDHADLAADRRRSSTAWDEVPAAGRPAPDSLTLPPERATHILDGDRWGGGHRRGTGRPGKTEFPADWDVCRPSSGAA